MTMLDDWADALKASGRQRRSRETSTTTTARSTRRRSIPPGAGRYLTDWYAAPVTGLNFNDNCVDITVTPTTDGEPAAYTVDPAGDRRIKVMNDMRHRRKATAAPMIDREQRPMSSPSPARSTRPTELESKPVTDPGAFFADALRTHLASQRHRDRR